MSKPRGAAQNNPTGDNPNLVDAFSGYLLPERTVVDAPASEPLLYDAYGKALYQVKRAGFTG